MICLRRKISASGTDKKKLPSNTWHREASPRSATAAWARGTTSGRSNIAPVSAGFFIKRVEINAPDAPRNKVEVRLQGDKDRIDQTLAAIRAGSKKSSQNNTISQVTAAWDPDLKTFTVFAWTSTSRNIMNPYDLVFTLRPANDQISHKDAKAIWNNI